MSFLRLITPRDHPHAYGDKNLTGAVNNAITGSSPRVWGQVYQKYDGNQPVRIIPTRMGTRLSLFHSFHAGQDHPHAYGDKYLPLGTLTKMTGSSPRVWGQACSFLSGNKDVGIIPTRMGTRGQEQFCGCNWKDHPHAYGDKQICDLLAK